MGKKKKRKKDGIATWEHHKHESMLDAALEKDSKSLDDFEKAMGKKGKIVRII